MRPLAVALALLLAACGPAPTITGGRQEAPRVWPLRGTSASGNDAQRRPIVVKLDNGPAARPQSGLANADLIWEIPVEGGITRYAVVFHSQDAGDVGPVRSARLSDLQYVPMLKAILVHVGGSEPVLEKVRAAAARGEFVDVDEFTNAKAFERVTTKQPPYNAYTSTQKARDAAGDKAKPDGAVPALEFSTEAPKNGKQTGSLTLPYAAASQRVTYTWEGGAWKRAQAGQPTKDAANNADVAPVNVVVIKTEITEITGTADVTGAPSVDFRSTGSGDAVILRDGVRVDGKWSRNGSEMYRFTDSSGAQVALRPGLTWIHIVPADMQVEGA